MGWASSVRASTTTLLLGVELRPTSVVAELSVPVEDFPLGQAVAVTPDTQVELERIVPTDSVTLPFFWVWGGDVDAFVAELVDDSGVEDVAVLDRVVVAAYEAGYFEDPGERPSKASPRGSTSRRGRSRSGYVAACPESHPRVRTAMSEEQSRPTRRTVLNYEVSGDERPSEGVVAAASDSDPAEMAPLAEAVDSNALDALFADRYDGTPRTTGHVQFAFHGYEVVVTDGGLVSVLESPGRPTGRPPAGRRSSRRRPVGRPLATRSPIPQRLSALRRTSRV